jgi:hypothetical protein
MSDAISQVEVRSLRAQEQANRGVLTAVVAFGADTLERTVQNSLELVETVRREAFHLAFAGIDLVETVQQSGMKVVRDAVGRLDKMSGQVTDGFESTGLAIAKSVRSTGELAGALVSGSARSLTGTDVTVKA